MDQWSNFPQQIDQAFQGGASAPPQPGMGAGNIPHAPGIISGKFGGASADAQQMYQGLQAQMPPPGQAPSPMGQPPQGQAPGQPMMAPMAQAQILDYLMKMMTQRASQGNTSPISSTGTF